MKGRTGRTAAGAGNARQCLREGAEYCAVEPNNVCYDQGWCGRVDIGECDAVVHAVHVKQRRERVKGRRQSVDKRISTRSRGADVSRRSQM